MAWIQQALFDETGGAEEPVCQTANPLVDASGAAGAGEVSPLQPKFCCDFGCGFENDSFQAVREHEHTCADRQRATALGYADVLIWAPVWRWRLHLFCFLAAYLPVEPVVYELTRLAVLYNCDFQGAADDTAHQYFQVADWNGTELGNVVGKPVTESNGVAGLQVIRGPVWQQYDQTHNSFDAFGDTDSSGFISQDEFDTHRADVHHRVYDRDKFESFDPNQSDFISPAELDSHLRAGGVTTGFCGEEDPGWIRIRWDYGGEVACRCGADGAYDLQIASSERLRLVIVPTRDIRSGAQSESNECRAHTDCNAGYYCDNMNTCYGCKFIQDESSCDTIDDDCSVVRSTQCNPACGVSGASMCTTVTCAEAAARNDTMNCATSALECKDDQPKMLFLLYVLARLVLGIFVGERFTDPWPGVTSRQEAEDSKTKKANGDTEDVDEESAGRNPRYAKCLRRVCVGCPRLSPDRKPGDRTPGDSGFLRCVSACHDQPAAVFDVSMLVDDEGQARAALSRGLDVHSDLLGVPKSNPVLNVVLHRLVQSIQAGPFFPAALLCIASCAKLLGIVFRKFGKLSGKRHNSGARGSEIPEEDAGADAVYSVKGVLGTSRPNHFVLPRGTSSPLVLAVLGSQELFETVLDHGGGAFSGTEQQHAALRLALLTERRDAARLIIASGQAGIEATDAEGNTVLQWLASMLVDDEPDTMLSFCRGQGIDRSDFILRTRTDGAWGRRVDRAMQLALELGADPRGRDKNGRTPLYCAVLVAATCSDNLDLTLCSLLLEYGGDMHAELNGDAGSHTTPAAISSNSTVAALREWSRTYGSYAGRFRLLDQLHQSETCIVFKGVDLERRREDAAVAVKIMRKETEWDREVSARQECHLDERYVVGVREAMRIDPAERARRLHRQGGSGQQADESEFVLAMPLGECSLFDAVSSERKVGRDVEWVRLAVMQMTQCLQHLHQQGLVHSDVKPRNFCRFRANDGSSRLCVIDMDAASRIGSKMPAWGAGLKASTAYAPPEVVTHILLGTTELPVSATSIDSWSLGCVLYELAAGLPLFNADRSDDNLNDPTSKIELLNWRTIDNARLARVFAESSVCTDAQRSAAQNLIACCLQADPSRRPSMSQILAHRFLSVDAPTPAPVPSSTHFFLSHFQKEAADLVRSLFLMLEKSGCSCWLDMEADNLTLEGMRKGVEDSQCFMLVLTHGVLFRPYCIEEIFVAAKLEKDVMLVCETEPRFNPFNYDEWTQECKTSDEHAWCLEELAKVEGRGKAAATHMMETVAGVIHANIDRMIPYRRRNFESNAMIATILARNGLHSISSLSSPDDLLRTTSVPVGGLARQASTYARAPTAPAALAQPQSIYVAIVHSTPAGDVAASSLQRSLRARGLSVGGTESAKAARRLLFILTDGALLDPAVLEHLRNAVHQKGLTHQRSVATTSTQDVDLEVVSCSWSFGSEEQQQACKDPAIARLFQHQEFLAMRPAGGNLNHEHEAMADEIVRRYAARDSIGVW